MVRGSGLLAAACLVGLLSAHAASAGATTPAGQSVAAQLGRISAEMFAGPDRLPKAIAEIKAILAVEPNSAEAHMLLGLAYTGGGARAMMGEAIAEFRQALALNSQLVAARFYLAGVYLELGRVEKARDELRLALASAPGQPQFLASLGEAERRLGHAQAAVGFLEQALAVDGTSVQARYQLALAFVALGRRDDAIRELERIVRSGAAVVDVYLALGRAYLDGGHLDHAVAAATEALQLAASRPDARILLARAYRTKGMLDRAEAELVLAVSQATPMDNPGFFQLVETERSVELGLIRQQQGQLDAAIAAFKQALEADPNHAPAHRALAAIYERQGLPVLAREHAARADTIPAGTSK